MDVVASVDRLTILGDVDGRFREDGHAGGAGLKAAIALCQSYSGLTVGGKYPYQSAFSLVGGGHVSFARAGARVPMVRVDVNPNGLEKGAPVSEVLALMFDTRCTRLDVAVDYLGEEVGDWVPFGRRAKGFTASTGRGAVETYMIGARSSARQLVVYDKVAESKVKHSPVPWDWQGPMMRVEVRERYRPNRKVGVLAPGLLDDVGLSARGAEWAGLKVRDRAMLHYLAEYPDARAELSREVRERLDSFIAVQGDNVLQPSPGAVYRAALPALLSTYFDVVGGVCDA